MTAQSSQKMFRKTNFKTAFSKINSKHWLSDFLLFQFQSAPKAAKTFSIAMPNKNSSRNRQFSCYSVV
jgi:hypothetical protein